MRYLKISLILIVPLFLIVASLYYYFYSSNTVETIRQSQTISRALSTPYGTLEISVPEVLEYELKDEVLTHTLSDNTPSTPSKMYMRFYFSDVSWFEIDILSPEEEYNRTGSYLGKTKTKNGYLLEKYSINNDGRINIYPILSNTEVKCQIRINATKDDYDNYIDIFKAMLDSIVIKS